MVSQISVFFVMAFYNFDFIYRRMLEHTRKETSIERLKQCKSNSQQFDDAYILPCKDLWKDGKCYGGVVDRNMNFIMSSAWHEGLHRCDKYDFDPNQVKRRHDTVIYMGYYNSCWGHAITDNIKKLWFLSTSECNELLRSGAKLVYITIDNAPMPEYVHRLFHLAGVNLNDFELITELTCFDRIIVPDNSFIADNGERYFTNEYKNTIKGIIHQVSTTSHSPLPNKIYFTRTGIKNWRDTGEENIEKVFRKKGYAIISPEKHTVDEQILMLQHCTHFAATEGSISHNAVFCRPGTEVTIIRKCDNVNNYQMALNAAANVNVTYIDAHRSTLTPENAPWVGPFYLYVNKNLKRWAGTKKLTLPYYLSLSWVFYHSKNNPHLNRLFRHANSFL